MLLDPLGEGEEDWLEHLAEFGHPVLDARWNLGVDLAVGQPRRLQFPQPVRQFLRREVGRRLVGFRHDIDIDIETDDPEPFQVLGAGQKPRRAWWQFWKR